MAATTRARMSTNNNNSPTQSSTRRGARGTPARSQSAARGHAETDQAFVGLDPNLPVVTLDGDKLQVPVLFDAIILQATMLDSNYNGDIEDALRDMEDIVIKPKTTGEAAAEFDKDFYPGGAPDAATDPALYDLYLKGRQKAADNNTAQHGDRLLAYISNKNKIRAMAMGQCDSGIQSLIKQSSCRKN